MFADEHRVAVLQHRPFDAEIVEERSIQAVEVLDHQRSGLDINSRVIVRNSQIINRNIIVGRPADRHRGVPKRNLFQLRAFKFQDKS